MKKDKKIVRQNHTHRHKRIFLQPLAIGIASSVFIALIIIMGIMDLRRSDQSLMGFIENQGIAIAEVIQRLTQENLNILVHIHHGEEEQTDAPLRDETLYPKTWLTTELADVAREVDNKWKADALSEAGLKAIASENGLWLIAVMNKRGKVVFQNRTLSADLLPQAERARPPRLTIELLNQLAGQKKIGYIALRRKDESGMVIIALDREGLIYWGLKVSVQKAIEKMGEGQKLGLVYMTVLNDRGMMLGSSGRRPEKWRENDNRIASLLAGTKKIESRKVTYLDKKILDMATPLYINGKIAGIVRVGLEKERADIILKENTNNLIFFMIFVVLITSLAMWLLYHNQNKHLAGMVEIERRLEKAERLSALGQLAAGVAHEIRNPLNAISMASQRLKRECMPADNERKREFQLLSGIIRDEIRRLNGIIEEFLSFSKTRRLELHNYPVTEVLQKIVNLIREESETKGIAVETEWSDSPMIVPMDMDKLQQALLNFAKNAMESIEGAGVVRLAAFRNGRDRVAIAISDTGCGMSTEEVERIFNPEYTTKEKGLGLGLTLAHEIIRGHGGDIRVSSTEGKGTTFEILLPASQNA